jgi:chemotaxis protein histidine kinase CheA
MQSSRRSSSSPQEGLDVDGAGAGADGIESIRSRTAEHDIFRVAHSLKGNATSLELAELAGFAHVVEDLLDVFREQQTLPSADLISLLLKAVDELRAMVSTAATGAKDLTPIPASSPQRNRARSSRSARKGGDDRKHWIGIHRSAAESGCAPGPGPSHPARGCRQTRSHARI